MVHQVKEIDLHRTLHVSQYTSRLHAHKRRMSLLSSRAKAERDAVEAVEDEKNASEAIKAEENAAEAIKAEEDA